MNLTTSESLLAAYHKAYPDSTPDVVRQQSKNRDFLINYAPDVVRQQSKNRDFLINYAPDVVRQQIKNREFLINYALPKFGEKL